MGQNVTLGGDRIGSGNKNKMYLRNYERSTHDLSERFTSTMGVGMLIPFMCKLVTRDDKFEINLSAGLRTIPTKGPLFGSFKLQVDVYKCPMRLYQALLHNNPTAIGLKANQVKFPKIRLYASNTSSDSTKEAKCGNSSLLKYLGISGLGTIAEGTQFTYRDFLGIPLLAYYDIFKNYYANKQEENAYTLATIKEINSYQTYEYVDARNTPGGSGTATYTTTKNENEEYVINISNINGNPFLSIDLGTAAKEEDIKQTLISMYGTQGWKLENVPLGVAEESGTFVTKIMKQPYKENEWTIEIKIVHGRTTITSVVVGNVPIFTNEVVLEPFKLSNLDDARMKILTFHQLGQSYKIDGEDAETIGTIKPYYEAIGDDGNYSYERELAGICVKTYQSDMYNNWLRTEWIDGDNGIAAITAISTASGSITIDALTFARKLYNLLTRVAVKGNTYQDYLDAAYTDSAKQFEETPQWIGGLSDEIVFDEVIQTAPTSEEAPLGTIGGRGTLNGKGRKGGKITVKIDEPAFIIGIVSITPRIMYTQGNEFYNTEIDNLMDIHVPALDGIAFQNLIGERLHFGSTILRTDGEMDERPIIGKVPAWIEYMSSVDKAYGDFAATDGDGYMILNRNYECEKGLLIDATTYIDPAKYNYAFAYTKRDAQNFWVSIYSDIKARRLMSAKQMPNA